MMKRIGLVVLYFLLCVGLLIPAGNLASPVSGADGASVTVSPAAQTVTLGGSFSVDIVVDPAGKGASGGEVNVEFDPTAMSADAVAFGDLLGADPLVGTKQIDNTAGTIKYALARVGATTAPTAAGVFATITFTGKDKPGTFAIDITFAGMADESFADITLAKTDGSVTFPGPTGTIEVTSSPVNGPYTISEAGGAAGYGGTAPSTYNDAPPGEYSIVWGEVAGYTKPAGETKTLPDGGTITFDGVYTAAAGTIEVTSSPVNGPFTISGAAGYSDTAPHTYNNAPAGEYSIVWGDVAGYTKPAGETKTLSGGETITFNGLYTAEEPEVGTVQVASAPVNGPYTITGPDSYSGTANAATTSIATDAPAGDYTIVWGDVAGYTKPADQTYTLTKDGTITFIGIYAKIAPTTGTINVTSSPVDGSFEITGPTTYTGTAVAGVWSVADAPAGDYTIVWGDVAGYTKPAGETKTLSGGETITFNGLYTAEEPEVGTIRVGSAPVNGPYTITGPASYSGTANATTTSIATDAPAGDYTIVWGDVAGYTKPADQTYTLTKDGTITFIGIYTKIAPTTGTINVTSSPVDGSFEITGPTTYTGTAVAGVWSVADAPAGTYTIVWGDVAGYTKPAGETLTLAGGGTITFNGVYTELPPQVGTIEVTSNVAAPFVLTSQNALFNGTADWTKTTPHLGEYSIIWGHVDGYTAPSSGLPQELTAGGTITFNGIYEPLPGPVGTVEVTSNIAAPYTVTGPATYTGTGDWTYNDAPVGTYTIHWGDVAGYTKPASETLTLTAGGTITFDGNYNTTPLVQWTHVFRDPKRGTVMYIDTCTGKFCFTAPNGFTTGVQRANRMTHKKGRINLSWRCGNLRVSCFAYEKSDYGQVWVTKSWRLKYSLIDRLGFEA